MTTTILGRHQILTNATTDVSSIVFQPIGGNPYQAGVNPQLLISGTMDTATITLECQTPDGDWVPTDPINDIWTGLEYSRKQPFYEDYATPFRLTISASGPGTSLSAWVWGCSVID